MELISGTTLQYGKYKIIRHISNGGFGVTYEAEHVKLHKRVAIKEFFVKDFCNRDDHSNHVTIGTKSKVRLVAKLKGKFIDEAVAISSLSHNNIVHVLDVFEENDTAYYVMDYIDGMSLHEMVKQKGALPESTALSYILQIAKALEYLHSKNRLHLDVKPGNIMVDRSGKAILIDFGASKQYDEVDGENTSTLIGKTPGYAPIEQMGNSVQTFDPATDVYSLGATLYKLLSGITPPNATDLACDDALLKPLSDNISANVRMAVYKSMQTKRKDRQQSMGEFIKMLQTVKKPEIKPSDTVIVPPKREQEKPKEPKPSISQTKNPQPQPSTQKPQTSNPKPVPKNKKKKKEGLQIAFWLFTAVYVFLFGYFGFLTFCLYHYGNNIWWALFTFVTTALCLLSCYKEYKYNDDDILGAVLLSAMLAPFIVMCGVDLYNAGETVWLWHDVPKLLYFNLWYLGEYCSNHYILWSFGLAIALTVFQFLYWAIFINED